MSAATKKTKKKTYGAAVTPIHQTVVRRARAELLEELGRRIPTAMLKQAEAGAKDGDLLAHFDAAKELARKKGAEGEKVLAIALADMLIRQAIDLRDLFEDLAKAARNTDTLDGEATPAKAD